MDSKTQKIKKIKRSKGNGLDGFTSGWDTFLTTVVGIFAFMCVFPFIFVVMISLTDEKSLANYGYKIIPSKFSFKAYEYVFKAGNAILQSYGVTIFVTIVGTILALMIMALYAYAVSRKNFKFRKFFTFFAFFTLLFSGGLVPSYIVMTQMLNLRDTVWSLILPLCCNGMNILILRTFFRTSVPDSIIESAKIDGASEFRTFIKIVLPISLPGLATIGLFTTLAYWNDWFNALLYIDSANLAPLQYTLMKLEKSMEFLTNNISSTSSADTMTAYSQIPQETSKMAMVVIAIGPIILAYPFFQKYFIQGLTIGAVKE